MARSKTKWTYSEIYVHTYKNLESILEAEKWWLESKDCRDKDMQKRKVADLEATLRIFNSYPGICMPHYGLV